LLSKGDIFPTAEDKQRIKIQTKHEALLLNTHVSNYKFRANSQGRIEKVAIDPLIPIPQTISDISADLLLGEFPGIVLPDATQDTFNDWAADRGLGVDALEGATYVSAIGTIFARLFKVDNEVWYKLTPGNKVIWDEKLNKLDNVKFVESVKKAKNGTNLIYEIQEWGISTGQLVIEHYSVKTRISDNEVIDTVTIDPDEKPGIDFLPIAKWLNVGVMDAVSGRSDYEGKEQLFAEIDNRIDQTNEVLQENAEPWKAVPVGVLNPNGQFNRASYQAKMFEKSSGGQSDNAVDIMTWDASLNANFTQIETMVDMTFFTARLSNSLTGREKGGVSESGRALKWKSVSTIAMMNRKKRYATEFLKKFINYWSRLEGKEIDKKEVKIIWQDGLPIDQTEETETIIAQVNAGLMSKDTAVQKLQELSTEEAEAEINKIQVDLQNDAAIEATKVAPLTV